MGTAAILFRGTAREFPFVKVVGVRGRRAKRVVPATCPNHRDKRSLIIPNNVDESAVESRSDD